MSESQAKPKEIWVVTHIKSISLPKTAVAEKGIDPAGAIFLQLWIAVVTWMIGAAFGKD